VVALRQGTSLPSYQMCPSRSDIDAMRWDSVQKRYSSSLSAPAARILLTGGKADSQVELQRPIR